MNFRSCPFCASDNTTMIKERKELALRSNNKRVVRYIYTYECKDCKSDFITKIEKIY